MKTERPAIPMDHGFARRSARYLAAHGYRPPAIRAALVEQLEMTNTSADIIVSATAA